MANVIGSGIARTLVDSEGDPVNVTGTALDVNIASGANIDIGDVEVKGHDTLSTFPQFAVGTTLIQLSSGDGIGIVSVSVKEMIIQADFDNTSFIMVGDDAILATEVDGIRINAGDTLILPMANTTAVYFRSDTADQKVNVALMI